MDGIGWENPQNVVKSKGDSPKMPELKIQVEELIIAIWPDGGMDGIGGWNRSRFVVGGPGDSNRNVAAHRQVQDNRVNQPESYGKWYWWAPFLALDPVCS